MVNDVQCAEMTPQEHRKYLEELFHQLGLEIARLRREYPELMKGHDERMKMLSSEV